MQFAAPLRHCIAFLIFPLALQAQQVRSLVPVEPYAAILDAFRTHQVVALSAGSSHEDARGHDFVVSLVEHPRFAAVVTDIVVEGTNSRFQSVIDRYADGAAVPDAEMRHIWDDTTQQQIPGPIWAGEIPALFHRVRAINASRNAERRVRILLGDPPIDWAGVKTAADFQPWLAQRDTFPAEMLRREVIARGRRALVLFGGGHFQRRQQATNYEMDAPAAKTLVSLVEASGTRVFVVRTAGDSQTPASGFGIDSLPTPSLAAVKGTALGASNEPASSMPRIRIRDGRPVPVPLDEYVAVPLQEQLDAVLYLGPASEARVRPVPRTICADSTYVQVRLQRMRTVGLPTPVIEQLRRLCGV
ncbi:MAG: hypothetical protein ABL986_24260, partial [Vicinamibacterales bacterium]